MAGSPSASIDNNPAIRVRSPPQRQQQQQQQHPSSFTSRPLSQPISMSIPGSQPKSPPPPLPPPRFVEGFSNSADPVHHFANNGNGNGNGVDAKNRSHTPESSSAAVNVKSGSSLLGGHMLSPSSSYSGPKKDIDFGQPETRASPSAADHATVAGDASDSANSDQRIPDLAALLEYNKLQGENRMGQRSNATSSQAYDKQLLSRIGGPRTPPRSAGGSDEQQQQPQQQQPQQSSSTPNSFKQLNGQLRPLSLPDRRPSDADHPRWTPNTASAFSPGLASLHSPTSDQPSGRSTQHRPTSSFAAADPRSHHSNYDHVMFGEHESAVDDSHPHDGANNPARSPPGDDAKTGQKRRAQSPPSESIDPNLRGSSGEWSQRQPSSGERHSQAARLHDGQAPSLSSTVSSSVSHGASIPSSYAMSGASTAATSYSSDRPSPSPYHQSGGMQPPSTPHSQHPPPPMMQQNGGPPPLHARAISSGVIRPPGVWICDCCPKKPKKFESEQDLRTHESEKQYICNYCHNRFKNKNEAERHQNSLHLRRHSWSCAALQSFENAFHNTSNPTLATAAAAHAAATSTNPPQYPPPAATDTCGYCGQEFPNPPDWDVRVEHLNHAHKFGECNQGKKFFRADHFRQHLKHSHAGTSGRWTNMLENACMREEAPPQPIHHGQPIQQLTQMGGMPSPMQGVAQPPPAPMQGISQGPPPQAQMVPPPPPQTIGQRLEQQSHQPQAGPA